MISKTLTVQFELGAPVHSGSFPDIVGYVTAYIYRGGDVEYEISWTGDGADFNAVHPGAELTSAERETRGTQPLSRRSLSRLPQ